MSFGLDRIEDLFHDGNMVAKVPFQVLVINEPRSQHEGIKATQELRKAGIPSTLYFDSDARIGAQLAYATRKGFQWVLVLEEDGDTHRLRAAQPTGEDANGKPIYPEESLPLEKIIERLKKKLRTFEKGEESQKN